MKSSPIFAPNDSPKTIIYTKCPSFSQNPSAYGSKPGSNEITSDAYCQDATKTFLDFKTQTL